MPNVSTGQKLAIAARIAAQQVGRSRLVSAVWTGIRASASSFGRILHQLWLEVTGFIFIVLAVVFGGALVREYHKYEASQTSRSRLLVALVCTLVFAWFGLNSFWRARRKR